MVKSIKLKNKTSQNKKNQTRLVHHKFVSEETDGQQSVLYAKIEGFTKTSKPNLWILRHCIEHKQWLNIRPELNKYHRLTTVSTRDGSEIPEIDQGVSVSVYD